jgi:hypothetical protein
MTRSPFRTGLLWLLGSLAIACSDDRTSDACQPDDLDGVIGGNVTFELSVSDQEFRPLILTAQNRATVTLSLSNLGTQEHGFFVECLPTPNDDGCPTESCFPEAAQIEPIEPGATETRVFEVPLVEGTYTIVSEPGRPEPSGQFVVK